MNWPYFLLFIISCIVLSYSGTWIVKSLVRVARFLKWKSFVVSSVLMGLSTSLPETFIGITSALHNKPELILGVVIGSNIIALTIVIGIGSLLTKGLTLKKKIVQESTVYAILYSLLPFLLIRDGSISRTDGVVLLASFVFYFSRLLSQQKRFTEIFNRQKIDWVNFKLFLLNLLVFCLGVFLLILSSKGVVLSTLKIAESFNMPTVIIGIFLIAFGTSLPEITFGIKSMSLKQENMIIGNAMGSIVTNSTLVLGIASLIAPITINDFAPYFNGIAFVLITCLFFIIFARTDYKITRREAVSLIIIYFVFILLEINRLSIGCNPFFNLQ